VTALRGLGVKVLGQIPVVIAPNSYSASYLEAKRKRMAHDLPPLLLAVGGDAE
jgi:GTP cyclohydrolase II